MVPGNRGNHTALVATLGEASKQQNRLVFLFWLNKCLIEPQELLCMPEGLTGLMGEFCIKCTAPRGVLSRAETGRFRTAGARKRAPIA